MKFCSGMNFKKKATAQDVIVCCCVLYNMLKMEKATNQNNNYTAAEVRRQVQIGQQALDAEGEWRGQFRIQDFLIDHYFN